MDIKRLKLCKIRALVFFFAAWEGVVCMGGGFVKGVFCKQVEWALRNASFVNRWRVVLRKAFFVNRWSGRYEMRLS